MNNTYRRIGDEQFLSLVSHWRTQLIDAGYSDYQAIYGNQRPSNVISYSANRVFNLLKQSSVTGNPLRRLCWELNDDWTYKFMIQTSTMYDKEDLVLVKNSYIVAEYEDFKDLTIYDIGVLYR